MRKLGSSIAALIFVLLFSFPNVSGAGFLESVSESRLENGLKVIMIENHKAPVVSFQVWYRAGARNDPWGKTGRAHVFEHLMFKGTKNVSKEEFTRQIQEIGGNNNAFTAHDFAAYFENVASAHIEVPIRLEADRMQHLEFSESDFKTERMVVMEERRLRTQDRPQAYLSEQTDATAFQAQPYHWPVIGWIDDLLRLEYQDLTDYYRNFYDPKNAFIVVAGDFVKDEILTAVSDAFGTIPSTGEAVHYRYQDPPQMGERRVMVTREASLPYVLIGYHVPNLSQPDAYVLEVISAILSSGRSSRLYKRLIDEEQLATSAGADYSLLSIDPRLFQLYAEALPGKTPEQLEAALLKEIERLKTGAMDERELQKAKNQLEADFVFGQDSLFFQAMVLARYEIVSSWREIEKYIPNIRSVSIEDVQKVTQKYFQPRNQTVGYLIPIKKNEQTSAPVEKDRGKNRGNDQ